MKKSIFSIVVIAIIALVTTDATAQKFSPLDKSPMDQASYPSSYKEANKVVKVTYSRPQLNDRPVAKLAPSGDVWRTGANEAVEITFYQDMLIGESKVEKGTYTMFTIPGNDNWTLIFSRDLNVWGSYSYNQKNDVARVMAPVMKGEESLEAFSIAFEGVKNEVVMHMGWGNIRTQTKMTTINSSKPSAGTLKLMKQ